MILGENAQIVGLGTIVTNNITRLLPILEAITGNYTITNITLDKTYKFYGNITLDDSTITSTDNVNYGILKLVNTNVQTDEESNWIINNNGAGDQIDLMQGFEFTRNTFVRISADGSYTVAGGPIASDGYVVYIDDQTGWDEITCYQWGDVNDFGGGWPGKAVDGTVTIGGITYKYFNYGADVKGLNQNLIFNNGGNGVQIGDFNFTFERDIYLTVTADKATEK